ncbi:class I SAM-dependent methyltransferase [Pseudoxanthomonas suwonensis]|uniref:class I SAM-dependent methyltransferase n=1 Tax=Pseudoxanthomonas suwonensis TaxID=314722 RepID=UPI0009E1D91A|nr:methyltransferase domain-containing protein [Pseudoxanthomonas suwonensis]
MDARLQRRVQRYGWDLAAHLYDPLWRAQLSAAHECLLDLAMPLDGEIALDVACGTGLVAFRVATIVGDEGQVIGIDISERMIETAQQRASDRKRDNVRFLRMDAEQLAWPDACFDLVVCAFGLMYMPNPEQALREIHRVLRPGGRVAFAVWGEHSRCGWSALFPIIDAEVASEVCPLFFRLGENDTLPGLCASVGFTGLGQQRLDTVLEYANAEQACDAAFMGGPVAMAWCRFSAATRNRVRAVYLRTIEQWRVGDGYRIPCEFVVVAASRPADEPVATAPERARLLRFLARRVAGPW